VGVEGAASAGYRLSMPAITHVFTIRRAAQMLNRDEELLWDLSDQLEPEDGMIWVYDIHDGQTLAFTRAGLDALSEIIRDQLDRTA
jgi:hypothetical protein